MPMTMDMMARCPFGYTYEIDGDNMRAACYCGVHFLYWVDLA